MSIFQRAKNLLSANVNSLFDSWEDPIKMGEQYMRNAAKQTAELKQATAGVMATMTQAQRRVDDQRARIDKMQSAALNAARANKPDDARVLLAAKNEAEADLVPMLDQLSSATNNFNEIKQAYDKQVADMRTIQKRMANIKADVAIAKAQETASGIGKKGRRGESAMAAFDRIETKTAQRRATASAAVALDNMSTCPSDALMKQYESGGGFAVEAELEALMAQAGNPISKDDSVDCEVEAMIKAAEEGNIN